MIIWTHPNGSQSVTHTILNVNEEFHAGELIGAMPVGTTYALSDVSPPEAPEQITARLTAAVQSHLDAIARADGWDSIYTASLRAAFPGPWREKGISYATWMDACWVKCHEVQTAVAAGARTVPTAEELISELPTLVIP